MTAALVPPDVMAGAADALHAAGDGGRGFDLYDEVDGAHVDAEFERRRGDEAAEGAELKAVFDFLALVGGDAAVVGTYQDLAGEFVHGAGDAFGEAAAVDEDEGGGVGANEFEEFGMDGAPDGGTHGRLRGGAAGQGHEFIEARHIVERNFDAEVDALGFAGVHDGDGAVRGCGGSGFELGENFVGRCGGAVLLGGGSGGGAAEEAGDFVERALRGGESDALQFAAGSGSTDGFETFQGEGEVTAALGGDEGVDFIEHDGLDGAQDFAGVGGE